MNRINVYATDEFDGSYVTGWFDYDRAEKFGEDTRWDGNNHVSLATSDQFDHQQLLRTAGGRWVLNCYSQWENRAETYEFVTDDKAREWLISQNRDEAVEKYFGELEDERGPGRPETVGGKPVNMRFGDDLTEQIKGRAQDGEPFAATVRRLLADALA